MGSLTGAERGITRWRKTPSRPQPFHLANLKVSHYPPLFAGLVREERRLGP